MAATRKYGTAPLSEIMEEDIKVCIQKAKSMRFKSQKEFYIIKTSGFYFAIGSMVGEEKNPIVQKWVNINYKLGSKNRSKWVCEVDNFEKEE